jgi:hypothetical protein
VISGGQDDNPTTYSNGSQEWYLGGKLHRLDGPAYIWPDGSQEWWQEGELHRLDGPAYIGSDGYQAWYLEGKRHRLDGPAVIRVNGTKEVWVWDKIPSVWNDHIVTSDQLDEEFSSARLLAEYTNCRVWWVDNPEERTLAILKYS